MANLIGNSLKNQIQKAMKDVFDTFKRSEPITFYKDTKKTIVMSDPNFNADFGDYSQYTSEITEETQSQSFYCRVWYNDYQPLRYAFEGDQNLAGKVTHTWGLIRIQMESDAYEFLKDSQRVMFFGQPYKFAEDFRRVGTLGEYNYYEVLLERVN